MTTLINEVTRARLAGIAAAMAKLYENGWIRDTGETVFRDARGELDDILRTAVEPITAAPVNNIVAMPLQQVEALVDAAVARIETGKSETAAFVVTALRTELESSDLAVMDAVAATRADILAALPKAEPAAQ